MFGSSFTPGIDSFLLITRSTDNIRRLQIGKQPTAAGPLTHSGEKVEQGVALPSWAAHPTQPWRLNKFPNRNYSHEYEYLSCGVRAECLFLHVHVPAWLVMMGGYCYNVIGWFWFCCWENQGIHGPASWPCVRVWLVVVNWVT